ncbi:rhamnulokinase [Cetobacterium sp.]|uniref:rhamnulokinase n=1 Tax=Cetobacterium sp. TaxID=2071632 RepID=UPI002FC656FC
MGSVLCFDLGASSGRAVVARYKQNNLELLEVHRFLTTTLKEDQKIYWDFNHIMNEIKEGIKKAFEMDGNIESIGIDTWGCDYGWINKNGELLRNPRSYRTEIPEEIIQEVHQKISSKEHYEICGNAYFNFNTIYQLYYDINYEKVLLKGAKEFLFIPNLIYYNLTGKKIWEYTIASTSGLLDAKKKEWSETIFDKLNFPHGIKGRITHPGYVSFPLKDEIINEIKIGKKINVSLVAGHDSACAVIGAPLEKNSAYLINGTWSLLGIENDIAITDVIGREKGIVNEGSLDKKIRFMSMIIGTWILQKLKLEWNELGEDIDFKDFEKFADQSGLQGDIEISEDFLTTNSMESLIKDRYFEKYNITIKEKKDILKVAYNSLGNKYKESLELIKELSKKKIENIVLLGGGNQDKFLIKTIKKYLDLSIELGPVEASVTGNAIVQLIDLKRLKNIDEARKIIKSK